MAGCGFNSPRGYQKQNADKSGTGRACGIFVFPPRPAIQDLCLQERVACTFALSSMQYCQKIFKNRFICWTFV